MESLNEKQQKSNVIEMGIFEGKHPKGFKVSCLWNRQKPYLNELMTDPELDHKTGIAEIRALIEHAFRIKAQAEVRRLCFEISGVDKNRNQSECLNVLTPEQVEEIRQFMKDWQYEAIVRTNSFEKKEKTAHEFMASLSEEDRAAFIEKWMNK